MFVCNECGASYPHAGFCNHDGSALVQSDDALLGQSVGVYRIAARIGVGGMGKVYKGVHPEIGSRVAIKVLSQECTADPKLVERFFSEARAVNLIRHENIVNVLDLASLPDGRPYIVMEYLDGEPLSALIRRTGPLPLGTLAQLMTEVLDALAAAHDKGIVHRDLKPDNIFVSPAGRAKVLDFGIAKLKPELGSTGDATRTGSLLGTPRYMSPEQAAGRTADARSDVYSVGVILYEGVTGRPPFDAPSLYELLKQHVEQYPPAPSSLRPDVPSDFEQVLRRALDKDPAARFQSARELAQALRQASHSVSSNAWAPLATTAAVSSPAQQTALASSAGTLPSPGGVATTTAPTAPGYVSGPVAPPTSNAPLSTMLLVGCGAIGLVGLLTVLALVGVGVLGGASDDISVADGRSRADRGAKPESDPTPPALSTSPTPTALATPNMPVSTHDHRKQSFDPWAYLPTASQRAKQHLPDARFVRLDITGMTRDGRVDLTMRSEHMVLYRYRSPSASKPPAGFPGNVTYQGPCMVYVMVTADAIRSFVTRWECDMPYLPKPRCSPVDAWNKAAGAPRSGVVAMLGYWQGPGDEPRWLVNIEPSFSRFVPDDC